MTCVVYLGGVYFFYLMLNIIFFKFNTEYNFF